MKVLHFPLVIFLFVCFVLNGYAQIDNYPDGHNSCISDQMRKNLVAKDPTYIQKEQQFNEKIRQMTIAKNSQSSQANLRTASEECLIPVVFHIVMPDGQTVDQFLPDINLQTRINNCMSALNNAFGGLAPYGGIDSKIKFILAQRDSKGHYTPGYTQLTNDMSNLNAFGLASPLIDYDDALINYVVSQNGGTTDFLFPNSQYINIIIVNSITENMGATPAGYAYTPGNPDIKSDVIIMSKNYFGAADRNICIIHEMGHFFGLYHTFEGGCTNTDCLNDGDHVCDTPPDATGNPNSTCSGAENSCPTDALNDLVTNYMDYGDVSCKNAFTQGQIVRMNIVLTTGGFRASLCGSPGTWNVCPKPVTSLNLNMPVVDNVLYIYPNLTLASGTDRTGFWYEVDFGDGSAPVLCDALQYHWGGITTNPIVYTYSTSGSFDVKITLKYRPTPTGAFLPECTKEFYRSVTSRCASISSLTTTFTASKTNAAINETISFTNTTNTCPSGGTCSYSWLKDGQSFSTNASTASNQISSMSGRYQIELQMTYNGCTVKSNPVSIKVGDNLCQDKRYMKFISKSKILSFENDNLVGDALNESPYGANVNINEAGAIISNQVTGEVVLYIDGNSIKGFNRQIISGGANVFAPYSEIQSSNQGNLILQNPEHSNIYYVFAAPDCNAQLIGFTVDYLSYVTVDINQGNVDAITGKPTGKVIAGPIKLLEPAGESMVAASKPDGSGYFLVTHEIGTSNFVTFEINGNGVNPYKNISSGIAILDPATINNVNTFDAQSNIMINQQGTQIVKPYGNKNIVEIYRYDPLTGKIPVNGLIISISTPGSPYFAQFSPDGKKLYVSQATYGITQYDLSAPDVQNSGILLNGSQSYSSNMYITPDGHLLVAGYNSLYEIKVPNASAANNGCGFVPISLDPQTGQLSAMPIDLTQHITYVMNGLDCVKPNVKGSVYSLLNIPSSSANTYQWSINQGYPPLANIKGSSSSSTVTLDFSNQSGTIELQCQVTSPCGTDIIKKIITIDNTCSVAACTIEIKTGNNNTEPTVLIPVCHPSVTLMATAGFTSYTWKKDGTVIPGATNATLVVTQITGQSQGGEYCVTGVNAQGCSVSACVTVIDALTITGDDQICPDQTAFLKLNIEGIAGAHYEQWILNGGTPTSVPSGGAGDYSALVVLPTFAACTLQTTVTKHVEALPVPSPYLVSYVGELNRCPNDPALAAVVLTGTAPAITPTPITSYSWNTGGSTPTLTTSTPGSYSITAMGASGCSSVSNTVVILSPVVTVTQSCVGGSVTLAANDNIGGNSYVWKDGSGTVVGTTSSITVAVDPVTDKTYTVTSTYANCIVTVAALVCNQNTTNQGTNLVTRGDFNISTTASPICTNYAVSSDLTCNDATTTPLNAGNWPSNFKITSNAAIENQNKWTGTGFAKSTDPTDIYCLIADGRVTDQKQRVWYQTVNVENCATYTFRALVDNIIVNEAEVPKVSLRIKTSTSNIFIKGTTLFANQPNWIELSGTWKSTVTGSVEISVVLDAGGWVGRDIAVDEIYFAKTNCLSLNASRIGRSCNAVANVGMDKYVCSGQSIQIGSNQTVAGLTYAWTAPGFTSSTANPTVSPTTTTTYKLVVTDNANNCSATDNVTVTIVTPSVSITKNITTGCTTQVKASLFNGIPNPQYEWQVNGVPTATNTTGVFSLTGIANGATVRCRLVTACASNIYSNTITVGTSAPVTATDAAICSGKSTQLHANMSGGTAPFTYTWTASVGAVPAAVAEPTVSPTATTTYGLTFKDANNCTFTGSVTVVVNALPPAVSISPTTACVGTQVWVTASQGAGNQLTSLTDPSFINRTNGTGGNGYVSYLENITAAGTGNFVAVSKSSLGCERTTVVPFTAYAAPPQMTVSISKNPACIGDQINVSVNYGIGNTLTSFSDPATISRIGGGGGPGTIGFSANVVSAGAGNFVGVSTNAQGCTTTTTVPFTVVSPPAMTIVPTSNPVCVGSTFTVNVNYGTGSGYNVTSQTDPAIISRIGGTGFQGGYAFGATAVTVGTGNFVGVVTSTEGCTTTTTVPFTVSPLPTAQTVTVTPNPACEGGAVTVGVTYSAGNTGSLTKPSMVGTATNGGGGQSGYGYTAPVTAAGTGNFVSTTVSAQGCSTVVNIPFTALPKPAVPAITSTGTLICSGSPILLSTTATGTAYQWYVGTTALTGATNNSYKASGAGTYTMRISDANGCWNTSTGIALTTSTLAAPRVHVDDATDNYCASVPVAMKVGTALQLNGTSQYVNVPGFNFPASGTTYGGPITVEFWVNTTGVYGSGFSIGGLNTTGNRAQAHVPGSDGSLYWDYGNYSTNGRISAPFSAYVGKWTHVAFVSAGNGGNFKGIYINGVLASSSTVSDGPDVPLSTLTIGKWMTYYTGGMMDEFRVWNKVLSASEVQAAMTTLYESGTPNLMGSWGFDEASGTTVNNDAFSAQTGTLMNSATRVYPTTGLTYTWTPSAYLTGTGTSVTPNTTVVRTYTVKGVDANGCSAYAQVVATPNLSCRDADSPPLAEMSLGWDVNVYPNPTEGEVHISFVNVSDDTDLSIEVIGMDGAVIFTIEHVEMKEVVNLKELPGGLYLIRVKNGEEIKTKKVVVVK